MSRRVSRPAAALLAVILSVTLSAPSAFAADYRNRDISPRIGPKIIRIVKNLGKRLGIVTNEDVIDTGNSAFPGPPKP